jgi:hypothetical protein
MRNQKGVSLIALIITIIVMIILAAIVMNAGGDTTSSALLAKFDSEFGDYADKVTLKALDIKEDLGIRGRNINDPQNNYMVAEGMTTFAQSGDSDGVYLRTLPTGYVLPETICGLLDIKYDATAPKVVAYIIDDSKIPGYETKSPVSFYGDSNGNENHLITSDGQVFTLPGFAVPQTDGTIEYHINSKAFYVVKGNSDLAKGAANVNGDLVDEEDPLIKSDYAAIHGLDQNNTAVTTFHANQNTSR